MSLYKILVRPLMSLLPAEVGHNFSSAVLRFVGRGSFGQWLLRRLYSWRHPSLEREVFGVRFANPIGAAAGLDRDATLYRPLGALGFGFVEIGTITPKPQAGGIKPRLFRLRGERALVHRMEFPNCGIEKCVDHLRRRAYGHKVVVGANIAPNSVVLPDRMPVEYLKTFRPLYQYVDYFTVNVAPIIGSGESYCATDKALVERVLDGLFDFRRGQNDYRPVLLKISPDWPMHIVDDMVQILIDTPLDGLVVADCSARLGSRLSKRQLSRMNGGVMGGAPLLERTIELVDYVCRKMNYHYPVIGVGGIMSAADAQRVLDAGASLVQCYSALHYEGPAFAGRTCRELVKSTSTVDRQPSTVKK